MSLVVNLKLYVEPKMTVLVLVEGEIKKAAFFEVKFLKELTSFQGSSSSKYDNFQR